MKSISGVILVLSEYQVVLPRASYTQPRAQKDIGLANKFMKAEVRFHMMYFGYFEYQSWVLQELARLRVAIVSNEKTHD